ncbi:MAG: hypothetical protein RAK23_01585 [Thermoplasmata archaeon]|nr:hypothetical protein [Thermoplasmata archaeon]
MKKLEESLKAVYLDSKLYSKIKIIKQCFKYQVRNYHIGERE